jgi:hypothetical protein
MTWICASASGETMIGSIIACAVIQEPLLLSARDLLEPSPTREKSHRQVLRAPHHQGRRPRRRQPSRAPSPRAMPWERLAKGGRFELVREVRTCRDCSTSPQHRRQPAMLLSSSVQRLRVQLQRRPAQAHAAGPRLDALRSDSAMGDTYLARRFPGAAASCNPKLDGESCALPRTRGNVTSPHASISSAAAGNAN